MSNIVVKMMSGEDLADENTSKGFELVEAFGEVKCHRKEDGAPLISIPLENGMTGLYHPEGNTYILHKGKTVSAFSYSELKDVKVNSIKGTSFGKMAKHSDEEASIVIDLNNNTEFTVLGRIELDSINLEHELSRNRVYWINSSLVFTLSDKTQYQFTPDLTYRIVKARVLPKLEGREDEYHGTVIEFENKIYVLLWHSRGSHYDVVKHPSC